MYQLYHVIVDSYTAASVEVKEKKIQLRFMESLGYMTRSLDSLRNLVGDGNRKLTGFEDYTDKQYELLIRKGVSSIRLSTCQVRISLMK